MLLIVQASSVLYNMYGYFNSISSYRLAYYNAKSKMNTTYYGLHPFIHF